MTPNNIARLRLFSQRVVSGGLRSPGEVVAALGAMQAQDYLGALWAVGLRTPAATEADVEQALTDRAILRSWPMRGALHFVAAADLRWMLALLSPRLIAASAGRNRQLELDETVFSRCRKRVIAALKGGRQLTREEVYSELENAGISPAGQRGYHILWRLAQEGLLCFGSRRGKQATFTLLDEWSPQGRRLGREEALAELAHRYFTGHGPATLQDFAWWSGLKISDARRAVESTAATLHREIADDAAWWIDPSLPDPPKFPRTLHLLPGFDEVLLGYTDRSAALESRHVQAVTPGSNGMFLSTIAKNGRVIGTWRRTIQKAAVLVQAAFFDPPKKVDASAAAASAELYGRFLERPIKFEVTTSI